MSKDGIATRFHLNPLKWTEFLPSTFDIQDSIFAILQMYEILQGTIIFCAMLIRN